MRLSCKTHFLLLKNRHVKLLYVLFNIYQVCVCVCVLQAVKKNTAVHGGLRDNQCDMEGQISSRHMILNKLHQISPHFKLSSLVLTCDTYSQHSPLSFFSSCEGFFFFVRAEYSEMTVWEVLV